MAIRVVEYYASSRLSCLGCTPADVILCVDRDLVKGQTVCENETLAPFKYGYIEAQLLNYIKLADRHKGVIYKYSFGYDDSQLIVAMDLTCDNINGVFCKGCLVSWVEDKVGNEISLATDGTTGVITLTTQHGCTYDIDAAVPLAVVDTATVNLTASGNGNHTLQADVNISATADNILVANADGLFVSAVTTPLDTATIDLTISNNIISGNAKISATAGNTLVANADGLFVPAVALNPLCGITIAGLDIAANVSSTWGAMGYAGADTDGEPVYCDGANQLRTAPAHFIEVYNDEDLGAGDVAVVSVTITNPSPNRSMRIISGQWLHTINYFSPGPPTGGPQVEISINGGAFVTNAQAPANNAGIAIGGTFVATDCIIGLCPDSAPGGNQVLTFSFRGANLVGGNAITNHATSLRISAETI